MVNKFILIRSTTEDLNLGLAQLAQATSAGGHTSPQTVGQGCPQDNFFSHLKELRNGEIKFYK